MFFVDHTIQPLSSSFSSKLIRTTGTNGPVVSKSAKIPQKIFANTYQSTESIDEHGVFQDVKSKHHGCIKFSIW